MGPDMSNFKRRRVFFILETFVRQDNDVEGKVEAEGSREVLADTQIHIASNMDKLSIQSLFACRMIKLYQCLALVSLHKVRYTHWVIHTLMFSNPVGQVASIPPRPSISYRRWNWLPGKSYTQPYKRGFKTQLGRPLSRLFFLYSPIMSFHIL